MPHGTRIGDVVTDDANKIPAALHQERIDHKRICSAVCVDGVALNGEMQSVDLPRGCSTGKWWCADLQVIFAGSEVGIDP